MNSFTKYALATLLLIVAACHAATAAKKQVIAPSVAWTLSDPLGLRYPSTIDTLHFDYHDRFVPAMQSKAWATTGNYGAQGQNQIFLERPAASDFFLEDALSAWRHDVTQRRYYNTRIPMTLIGHATGGDKYSNQDRTVIDFSGNATKNLSFGANLDYIYSKGSYDYQADKDFQWGLNTSYLGDRYELHAALQNYNMLNKENGGITDDRYITDPAEIQGGDSKVSPKDIPTNLTAAHTRLVGTQVMMNHRYKVGHYHYLRDSVTDTIVGRTYIPVTSFIWTLSYSNKHHKFINTSGSQDTTFWSNTYLATGGTDEVTRFRSLRNTVGVSLLEGFNKYAKAGLAAFATHEWRRYTQVTDTVTGTDLAADFAAAVPDGIESRHTDNLVWVGAQLTKQRGSLLTYDITARFGVVGDVSGDIDVNGNVGTRFKLLGDSVSVRGYGYFKNQEAPWLMKQFVSNHHAWNNSFGKERRLRLGGTLDLPHTGTHVDVGYETLKNYLYFGTDATPQQHSSPIHVFSASLRQHLAFKALHWVGDATYQTSSNEDVLSLPKFSVYSNLWVQFVVSRVLHVQIGLDGTYYTKYYAPAYAPAIATFHNQRDAKYGDFAFVNAYANFKMKQARFFVAYTHVNKGIVGGDNYFSSPHYPLNPGRFQLGVSVNFAN